MAYAPTTAELLDFDRSAGVRMRADRYRFDLVNHGDVIGEVHPDLSRPPTVSVRTDSTIKRSMTGFNLPASEAAAVNPIADRVRPVMVLQNGDEEPLGLFMWADDSRPVHGWGRSRASSLVDETHRLDQGASGAQGWGKGTSVIVIAVFVATSVLPSSRVVYTAEHLSLAEPKSWPIGTSRMSILGELMEMMGFLPPHMDRHGDLYLVDVPDLTMAAPVCSYGPDNRIEAGTLDEWDDVLDAPNRYTVTSSGSSDGSFIGRYDVPSSAPHSIANRDGFVITDHVSMPGISSQTQADRAARTRARVTGPGFRYATFTGPADFRHDMYSTVSYDRADGEGYLNYLETDWSLVCRSGGRMSHTLRRPY